jgi:hypothetical protein
MKDVRFVICEDPLDPYFVVLENLIEPYALRSMTSGEIKKIARILGVVILKWREVEEVTPDMYVFNDPKFKTSEQWEEILGGLKTKLKVEKEVRDDKGIAEIIDQIS